MIVATGNQSDSVPAITVGMPVYNGERYLAAAIESVLAQTDTDFELIISDNASTDASGEIARDFAARDRRVIYRRQPRNVGAAANYNDLFHWARSPFFRWMNADDLIEPTLHERCRAALEAHPDAVLAYGRTRLIDASGAVIDDYDDCLDLRAEQAVERFARFYEFVGLTNVIYGLMRRDALGRTSLMGDGSIPAADTRMMGELILRGKFIALPPVLFYRRMHAGASSWDRGDQESQSEFWGATRGPFKLPHWRLYLGYLRYVGTLDLPRAERWRIRAYVLRRMRWERSGLLADLLACRPWRRRDRAADSTVSVDES